MIFDTGRVCMKTAGRDSNKYCAVLEVVDDHYVVIDGDTRRKKCNTAHLEPMDVVIKVTKSSSKADVVKALQGAGLNVADVKEASADKKKKRSAKSERPRKLQPHQKKPKAAVTKKDKKAESKAEAKAPAEKKQAALKADAKPAAEPAAKKE